MLLGLVSFPIFTRLFSVDEYGLISLVLKTITVFTVLAKMGVQHSVLRFYQDYIVKPDRKGLCSYYSTLYCAVFAIAATIMVMFGVFVWLIPSSLISQSLRQVLLVAAGFIFVRGVYSVLLGFWRVEERSLTFNLVDAANRIGVVAVVCALAFVWGPSVRAYLGGTLAVEATSVFIGSVVLSRRGLLLPSTCDLSFLKKAVTFGAPLVLYELFSVVLADGDRFLVRYYLGVRELGYYSAAYNLSQYLQDALIIPLNLALFPIYMRLWTTKGKQETQTFLSTVLNHFALASIGLVALVTLTAKEGVVLLASQKFQQAYSLLPLLVAALLLAGSKYFIDPGLLIYRKTGVMARIVVYATVVNVILNVLLLPRLGLWGAGLATLLSYVVMIGLTIVASSRFMPIPFHLDRMAKYAVAAVVVVVAFRGVHTGYLLTNVLAKGLLGSLGYLAVVATLDKNARILLVGLVRPQPRSDVLERIQSEQEVVP